MAPTELDPRLFLPEPAPREVSYTVISVDDHVVEPPGIFERYMPRALLDHAPRVVETDTGKQEWLFDGQRFSQVGVNAIAGRRRDSVRMEPFRFDQMRPGCYDAAARVHDMNVGGIWAMLNFPSAISGFCGRVFAFASNAEVGLAATRAWNDWIFHEWFTPFPDRIIPCGITYMADPQQAAYEIRRNAERGFVAVTLPERPHMIGLPNLWDRSHWDPIIGACVDTDTVICLHIGSSGTHPSPPGAPPIQLGSTLFGQLSLTACAEWLWSGYPLRHPTLKIALSEGGIGWVAMLLDRLDNIIDRSGYGQGWAGWDEPWDERPSDVLKRNFNFCTIDDPSTMCTRYRIGIENIMLETDYPHGDGTWPDTQDVIRRYWGDLPADELRAICCENAARLFRHPLPPQLLPRVDRTSRP